MNARLCKKVLPVVVNVIDLNNGRGRTDGIANDELDKG